MSRDVEDFLTDITWYFREREKIKVMGERKFKCSLEFENTFPLLTRLLKNARITTLQYQDKNYQLFGWTDHDLNSLGWLCYEPMEYEDITKPLHPSHILLLQNFGGVTERWNEPDSWLCNLNYALPYEHAEVGFDGWEEPFRENCEEEGIEVTINPDEYITFAVEANGNVSMYHAESGEVIMYAHDHAFDHVQPFKEYPEYTLYRINDCKTLVDWVETVAEQWLSQIID